MAATFVPIRPVGIQACATSGHRRADQDRRRSSSSNWWVPLFGWSSEPDYIGSNNKTPPPPHPQEKPESESAATESKPSRPRFAGCFTQEKARQLRMMTMGTESFHDTMYHSAIASRLASDFKAGSDQ